MSLSDYTAVDLDRDHEFIVVLVNANDENQTFTQTDLTGFNLELHPVQANSVDPVVKTSTFDVATGTFEVPGRTTAVFVVKATPQERIEFLKADVQALVDAGLLSPRLGRALLRDLNRAEWFLNQDNWIFDYLAAAQMRVFIRRVEVLVWLDLLPAEAGQDLIDEAWLIIEQILND
jgi:hypothetical protein